MAVPQDASLTRLLDQYVCVRLVQMWGMDLTRFQFDGSLTWALFLMHADGTIYARYGSRSGLHKHSEDEIAISGLKETLQEGIDLHLRYVLAKSNLRKVLAAKTGPAPTWRTPEAIPWLEQRGVKRRHAGGHGPRGDRSGHCIHCHMVQTGEILSLRGQGKAIPDKLFWPYPLPQSIGLTMDRERAATVKAVAKESRVARLGVKPGDRIVSLGDQPILSPADIQWVLHHVEDGAALPFRYRRGGKTTDVMLLLPKGWRHGLKEWRFINMGLQNQVLAFNCRPVPAGQLEKIGLKQGSLALRVERIRRRDLRDKDLRRGDVIVEVDGSREAMTMGAWTAYVLRDKAKGEKLDLVVRRGEKERPLSVTLR